jgi:hypothetical protein
MIALRLAYARKRAEEDALRQTARGSKALFGPRRARMSAARPSGAETVYRVSLDDRVVYVSGAPTGDARHQRIWFDSDREARDAYLRV